MYIKTINRESKSLIVAIPLTTTSGKIRVKERDNIYGYGLPFASRSKKFNQKNYIEWQIGYDIETISDKMNLTTLKEVNFVAYNNKKSTKNILKTNFSKICRLTDYGFVQVGH